MEQTAEFPGESESIKHDTPTQLTSITLFQLPLLYLSAKIKETIKRKKNYV